MPNIAPRCTQGCSNPLYARGYCKPCYMRLYRARMLAPVFPRNGCTVPDCKAKHQALGYCKRHYLQIKRNGRVGGPRSAEERLLAKVIVNPATGCWEWQGAKTVNGYGMMGYLGYLRRSHRVAMALYRNFDIANPLQVLHRCDNRACVNVEHLFIGTNQDNVDDKMKKGRHRTTSFSSAA